MALFFSTMLQNIRPCATSSYGQGCSLISPHRQGCSLISLPLPDRGRESCAVHLRRNWGGGNPHPQPLPLPYRWRDKQASVLPPARQGEGAGRQKRTADGGNPHPNPPPAVQGEGLFYKSKVLNPLIPTHPNHCVAQCENGKLDSNLTNFSFQISYN